MLKVYITQWISSAIARVTAWELLRGIRYATPKAFKPKARGAKPGARPTAGVKVPSSAFIARA